MRCLVLGGTGALGAAVVGALATRGARVVFTYHTNRERADELVAPGVSAARLDLTDEAAIRATVEDAARALGGLDALIGCAGVAGAPDADPWDHALAVNTRGPYLACRCATPLMAEQGGGNIVLTASLAAVKALPLPVPYAASSGASRSMVAALAKEIGPLGVCINLVAPGLLEGGLSRHLDAELKAEYLKHCGLKRFGQVEEIAAVIAWLAAENTYVSGQTIVIDGAL